MVYALLKDAFEEHWVEGADGDDPGIDGREYPVPKPEINIEKDRDKIRLRGQDHINIVDGGDVTHEPKGVGYIHEEINETYNIEVRTTQNPPSPPDTDRPGRTRFDGYRGGTYGGLKGEIKRILDLYRKGTDCGYTLVQASTWRDDSGNYGANHYYGMWIVEPTTRASKIDTQDPTGLR
jgi:hypothetical protein